MLELTQRDMNKIILSLLSVEDFLKGSTYAEKGVGAAYGDLARDIDTVYEIAYNISDKGVIMSLNFDYKTKEWSIVGDSK